MAERGNLTIVCAVQFIIGWHFHAGAVRALRRGTANMDVLVSLGTNAAYIYSVISAVHRRSLHTQGIDVDTMGFFETSALLITFISLGKYLESHAKGRTSQVGLNARAEPKSVQAIIACWCSHPHKDLSPWCFAMHAFT